MDTSIKQQYLPIFYKFLLIATAILALMSPALINGFPLVYSDTGTYIAAAKTHSIPVDRPIGYSLFLNVTSMNISLWFTIIVQCVIIFYLIFQLFNKVFQIRHSLVWTAGCIVLLSFTTSISNYSSQLMPDIFVSWMILSVVILLFQKEHKIIPIIFLSVIFVFSAISHLSVLLLATVLFILLLLFNNFYKWIPKIRNYILLCWLVVAWISLPVINSAYGAGFTISRCNNVFIMGRFVETGVIKDFLNENCQSGKYTLCEYKDSLPELGYVFLWEMSSPLYKGPCLETGWGNCWIDKDKEYGKLIHDIVFTPKYLKRLIAINIKATYYQIIDFKIGLLTPMNELSAPYVSIKTFYPQNLRAYTKAEQFKRILYFNLISKIQKVLVFLTLIALPMLIIFFGRHYLNLKKLYYPGAFIVLALIINAAICSSLATVIDRYQSRVIWLIPFLFLTAISLMFSQRKLN